MCNTPVTLGGGITTVYGSRSSGVELKNPFSNHHAYHLSSVDWGLYVLGNSIAINESLIIKPMMQTMQKKYNFTMPCKKASAKLKKNEACSGSGTILDTHNKELKHKNTS